MRVLVVANEQVGSRMAGPAIRSYELARHLSRTGAAVTLAMPREPSADAPDMADLRVEQFGMPSARGFRALASAHDVVVTQPQRVDVAWGLRRAGRPAVYDLYVPSFIERIAQLGTEPMDASLKRRLLERDRMEYTAAIELGSAFICATQRQKDHWLGALGQAGRLDLELLSRDPLGDQLVGVVPFGLAQAPPPRLGEAGGAIRGTLVPEDSVVLLWTGGLWNWFDPVTVVEALARAREHDARLRLVVMGMHHPEAHWQEQDASRRARERAAALGLIDAGAFVATESWVPYAERHRYLLDADIAVSAHHDTLETRLSYRTRFLDHLWAGLPTITTAGDELAERMSAAGAARTVAPADVEAWSQALTELAGDQEARQQMSRAARSLSETMHWAHVAAPLERIIAGLITQPGAARRSTRPRRGDAARYAALVVRVRAQSKGLGSLSSALRGAAGS